MHWKSQENELALVKQATDCLILTDQQLCAISDSLSHEISAALAGPVDNSLHVYPTFISQVPDGCERGKYLALDLGGTNFRVLLIHLKGNRHSSVLNETYSISQELMQGHGQELFDYIALCLFNFVRAQGLLGQRLLLGFTFSFPCTQTSLRQAVLTKWTKGFSCADTVGQEIGQMLNRAIGKHQHLQIEVAAIVNDTTGTLISCAYQETDCRMGVIVGMCEQQRLCLNNDTGYFLGTGVNICYMETTCFDKQMIVNTELGAFGSGNKCLDFMRTEWDLRLDRHSINTGHQLFEKMVSGMYLGELVRLVVTDLVHRGILDSKVFALFSEPNCFITSYISQVEQDPEDSVTWENTRALLHSLGVLSPSAIDCKCLHLICTRISRRSAHLTSAVISSLLRRMSRARTVIGVDGSVYRCHPHYKTVMKDKISQLLQRLHCGHLEFRLMLSQDGSGRGAALVSALPLSEQSGPVSKCSRCREYDGLSGELDCRVCAVTA